MSHLCNLRLLVLCVLLSTYALCQTEMKITVRTVYNETPARPNIENPMVNRNVYYRSGTMRRKDAGSGSETPSLSSIANCETKTGYVVFLPGAEYRSYKLAKFQTAADVREYLQKNPDNPYHIGFVQVDSRTVDTGERKTFFGYEAKHLITTTKRASVAGRMGGEETIDGWYIDHEQADNNCAPDSVRADPDYVIPTLLRGPMEVPEIHHSGPLPVGVAVKETHTAHFDAVKGGEAAKTVVFEKTVEELSGSPLKPSTFELPAGLKENPQLYRNGWKWSGSVPGQP
jgi:hypothetical protein